MAKVKLQQAIIGMLSEMLKGDRVTTNSTIHYLVNENIPHNPNSVSPALCTLVNRGYLMREGPGTKPVVYTVTGLGGRKIKTSPSPKAPPSPAPHKLTDTDIGRAIVDNIFEMRKLIRDQQRTIKDLMADRKQLQESLKLANMTIEKRNRTIDEMKAAKRPTRGFTLGEVATIKGG